MSGFTLFAFSMAAGFAVSGIAANLYRVVCERAGVKPESQTGKLSRMAVMVVAGPNVLFATALRHLRDREWKPIQFWIISALVGYWSFALGLFVIDVAIRV